MITHKNRTRRDFLLSSIVATAATTLVGCGSRNRLLSGQGARDQQSPEKAHEGEVTATEDLMREHGVLRRALLVYTQAALRLRRDPRQVPSDAIHKTAMLFRAFGEEYHEKKLEETFIFPVVSRGADLASRYPAILVAQHQRGHEITDYILAVTAGAQIGTSRAEPLARALESLVLMYRHHAAREDTVVFPAWKQALSTAQLDEMGERFEEIEHQQFGTDGFEDAVRQIGEIEISFGMADLAQFTAAPPPVL